MKYLRCAMLPDYTVMKLQQVELKRENEYIPIFKYILSFKDSSS